MAMWGLVSRLLGRSRSVLARRAKGVPASHGTDRPRADQPLESSSVLPLILDNIGDGVVVADAEGKFLLVNPAARQILGISSSEEETRTRTRRSELFLPDRKTPYPVARLPLARAIRGEAVEGEEIFVRPAAAPAGLWISASGRPLKDEQGRLRGGVVVLRDITERRQAEETLRQRADVVQLLHAAAAAANEASDIRQAVQTALDRVCANLGWGVGHAYFPADDGSGDLRSAHIWHLEDAPRFDRFRQATEARRFAAGEGLPGQVLSVGKPVWLFDLARGLTSERAAAARHCGIRAAFAVPVLVGKEVAAVLEFFTTQPADCGDALLEAMANVGTQLGRVVERQRLAQALREREELSRSIIETANEAFVAIDACGLIIDWNRQAELTFGWTRQEILGQALAETIIPPRFRDAHLRGMKRYFASGEGPVLNKRIELTALHRQGHEFPVELTIAPLRLGQTCRFNAFIHDISERKQAEERVRRFAAQLEQSNRELQEFAFVASHDLQEPLRKIQAFGDRLQARHAGRLDEEGRDYLQRMLSATGRMQDLIDGLLTYSRVSSKAQPFAPVDLGQLAREVVSDLESRIQQSGGRVEIGELPTIEADGVQMRQLLQNLIGNSLKFHKPNEPPRVEVQARLLPGPLSRGNSSQAGPAYCTLTVEDHGIGFDEKYRDRIFQVFQRLHGRGEYEGTGMGLAICRRIVERHHGWITAKSTPGQGATFIVTLPVRQPKGEHANEEDPRLGGDPHGR
jgi:two-component system sensor kinase FixL